MSDQSVLEFPAEFPIKVMGKRDGGFAQAAREIVERHAGPLQPEQLRERPSSDGNFLALTFTIQAQSREQLDAIYRDLTACKLVVMAL